LKKSEILRGGAAFDQTVVRGDRVEGKYIRCYVLFGPPGVSPLRVGFAVPSRRYNAVRRNRMKRLLREAVAREKKDLECTLQVHHSSASMVFFFKGAKDIPMDQITLKTIHPDVAHCCRAVATRVSPLNR
jgi:ribonuclease P protein component